MALVFLIAASALAERVTFKTSDGVEIVADYIKGAKDAPAVLCIPMFRNVRATYLPLVLALKEKKFHVLVLDARGHGESAPELKKRVEARDPKLFNAMHLDVEAGMRFLESEKGCDRTRIGLVGASVGCSVAVDSAVRHPGAVRAVVLLTPGSEYLGVPTLEHLKRWPGTAIFTFTSTEEQRTSDGVIEALRPFDGSSHIIVPGKQIHGTRMFGKVAGIEETIANFMESRLTGKADLRVPQWPEGSEAPRQAGFFGKVRKVTRTVDGRNYTLMTWVVGDRWHYGALVDGEFKGKVTFKYSLNQKAGKKIIPLDTSAKPAADSDWSQASFRGKTWVTFSIAKPAAARKAQTPWLELTFSESGKRVRLPASGSFAVHPEQAK